MSLHNALQFIKRATTDPSLRDRLNGADSPAGLQKILEEENLPFSPFAFEDAINSRLVQCRTWEEADELKEIRSWWELLQQLTASDAVSSRICSACGAAI